jgi:hypothetical protein
VGEFQDQTWRYEPERPVDMDCGQGLFGATNGLREKLDTVGDQIVASALAGDSRGSMTFLLSGRWGTGKSSALRYIWDYVSRKIQDRVVFARYVAPLYEDRPNGARAGLLFEVMLALQERAGDRAAAVNELAEFAIKFFLKDYVPGMLEHDSGVDRASVGRLQTQRLLAEAVADSVNSGVILETWLAQYRALTEDEKISTVLLIDDLDRCNSTRFIKEVLVATDYWSELPNHFFVIAADDAKIRQALAEHLVDAPTSADRGLAKYVHVTVRLPGTIPTREAAATLFRTYLTRVSLDQSVRETLVKHLETHTNGVGILDPLLLQCTPRTLKERFNSLIGTLRVDRGSYRDWPIKRAVLEIRWPDAFSERLGPVELGNAAQAAYYQHLLAIGVEALKTAQPPDHNPGNVRGDLHSQELAVVELARVSGLDVAGLDPLLALYLATAPQPPDAWLSPLRSSTGGPIELGNVLKGIGINNTLSVVDQAEGALDGADDENERALQILGIVSEQGDAEKMRAAFETTKSILDDLPTPVPRWAPILGNMAIRFSTRDLDSQALALHISAVRADPDHTNVALNFVDFILDHNIAELYAAAHQILARLEAGPTTAFRTRLYRLRLDIRASGTVGNGVERLAALAAEALKDGSVSSQGQLIDLVALARDLKAFRVMPLVGAALLQREDGDPAEQAGSLRTVADTMARSEDPKDEEFAFALYRFLLTSGVVRRLSQIDQGQTLENMAALLSDRGKRAPAGYLLWHAFLLEGPKPDLVIRLARNFSRLGDADTADALLKGELDKVTRPPAEPPFEQPMLPSSTAAADWLAGLALPEHLDEEMLPELWQEA